MVSWCVSHQPLQVWGIPLCLPDPLGPPLARHSAGHSCSSASGGAIGRQSGARRPPARRAPAPAPQLNPTGFLDPWSFRCGQAQGTWPGTASCPPGSPCPPSSAAACAPSWLAGGTLDSPRRGTLRSRGATSPSIAAGEGTGRAGSARLASSSHRAASERFAPPAIWNVAGLRVLQHGFSSATKQSEPAQAHTLAVPGDQQALHSKA